MSSQYSLDIPLQSSHQQQSFKLIELPPELLVLLESDNKPTLTVTSSPSSPRAPSIALLDTGAKIYQMRQKNTSNPIMLLKPSATGPTATDDHATFIPEPSVCSISKIEDTIELVPYEARNAEKAPPKVNKWHEKFAKGRAGAR